MGWLAVLAGELLRRPVVITENSSEWPRRLMTPAALRRARRSPSGDAALVCPVNERLQRAIESYGVRARFRVVPNTVDTTSSTRASRRPGEVADPARQRRPARRGKGLDVLLRRSRRSPRSRPELTLELIGTAR